MDLLLELLRFGTAILAGGLVAVIAQRLAYDHARKLEAERDAARTASIQRALRTELGENIERCDRREGERSPRPIERTAWDQARALPLSDSTVAALASGYALGADLNTRIAIVDASLAKGMPDKTVVTYGNAKAQHDGVVDASHRIADEALAAFRAALEALKAEPAK